MTSKGLDNLHELSDLWLVEIQNKKSSVFRTKELIEGARRELLV
ncbi:MAG TPA: hypothetical protein VKM55_09340 [Candidatus Lokiarchaeia archaeon]|nr:hypothetical protein [Candidatus Lokiarchaeia archaeon]